MIAIVDYEAGNLTSVWRAFAALGLRAQITREHGQILSASHVVFPGVGNAAAAMQSLNKFGLDEVLGQVLRQGTPLLGICLGCQIILQHSQEGNTVCLGLLPGMATRFPFKHTDSQGNILKVPHMGWNSLRAARTHPVLQGVPLDAQFYFVHSFYPSPELAGDILATTDYGYEFTSMVARDNLVAAQFHPEKSGRPGLKILANFAAWKA